ncbi:aminotransferase class I/II-fold pyridoxal phosphate-dependent enzyme [Chryseobacterium nematophagum]|uniref:Aminotransferase class I/II-fold pyridoxal phosphate-dependent enzyme n=1 Tax=Chryseobacterium nematophagum TaxID=2305228 RepID=A0A3M7LD87_9FLAO|nr:aminotransferase class I/II-fold pyridoxal phosphate-dependent enzyme [Chryseobacterium nematophagum]RMZ59960.1 aminotransferase class I/II-fold pyridoxal phosphate-dependent enzyme [Chryseobacterium nematophagum]
MQNIYKFNRYELFTEMSQLAATHGSFDLSLGLPDFGIDERLKLFLKEAVDSNTHNYAPLEGNPLLIENIIHFNKNRKNSIQHTKEEITVVPCATFALFTALKCIVNPGDEVIIIEPAYYTYGPSVTLNGGVPVYCTLNNDFTIDWENVQHSISPKTKAIIVNSPQNPTGKIFSQDDWNQLYKLIKDQEIYVISEEIYDLYCYDNREHFSSFIHPELKKRTFCIFSFGKMLHISGWKVSYMLASEELTSKFRFHQQYISYGVNAPVQYALAKFLEVFVPSEMQQIMQKKRDLLHELIKDTPLMIEQKSNGSIFQIINFRNISNKMTDIQFAKWLTVDKKVACLPLSAFYNSKQDSNYIRVSFAKKDSLIIEALEHLRKAL